MSIFRRQIKFINDFEKEIFKTCRFVFDRYGFVVADYVTEKQLFNKGIDGNNKKLEGYSRTTIKMKIRKSQPYNRTTTRDEGHFHESITVDAFPNRYEISSSVSYDKYIVKRYGKNIFKLTNENLTVFLIKYFIPKLKKYVKNEFAK